ncbi:relaxase/mobilization nuclease domain-containing protein [uncultured Thomasclavelia sp.]|uniref:relaxase/mobilization nuclease domain-containing protein n=1 Tax=uncultured Thomasclavelia sp. TaxID=3025759 RepID=UPI00280A90C2|nr:relaxase/mobilization nuclease domain-containing protein [uncultured Thomasclavelia sp.]
MATTKIIKIKVHPQKAIDYICNPDKTDEGILIDSYGCNIKTAKYDFERAQHICYHGNNASKAYKGNKAYHLIQSFAPGELTPDLAHKIGKEYADKILQGKYSYVITTHINKGHIHNHIVFCSADNFGNGRYNDCTRERYRREKINDDICMEYGLSVIDKTKRKENRKALKYNEWEIKKSNKDWKKEIADDIDFCINISNSYNEFIDLMRNKGYIIDDSHKHITFINTNGKKIRGGTLKNINGESYSREEIKEKILNKSNKINDEYISKMFSISPDETREKSIPKSKKQPINKKPYIVDTHRDNIRNSYGLNKWAHKNNLKNANDLLNFARSLGYNTFKTVYIKLDSENKKIEEKEKINDLCNRKIIENRKLLKYANDYINFKKYNNGYNQAYDKEMFFEKYENQLISYNAADEYLKSSGFEKINEETIKELQNNIADLNNEISKNIIDIKNIKNSINDLNYIRQQWDIYMNNNRFEEPKKQQSKNDIEL